MTDKFFIAEGLVIEHHGVAYEYARSTNQSLQFQAVENGEIITLTEGEFFQGLNELTIRVVPVKSSPKQLDLRLEGQVTALETDCRTGLFDSTTKKAQEAALRRDGYVRHLRRLNITKGQIALIADEIPRIAKQLNDTNPPGASSVARWMSRYEKNGGTVQSLFAPSDIHRRRVRRTPEHDRLIAQVIDEHYMRFQPEKPSNVYQHYKDAVDVANWENQSDAESIIHPVSQRTFSRIIASLDRYEVNVAQLGRQEARKRARVIRGHLPADYPLEVVEMDHTLLDHVEIDDKMFIPLGRPWLTLLRDRFSGVIIGLFVSFVGPSLNTTLSAIWHSLRPHSRIKSLWPEIEHELPWGLAQVYVSDRGTDYFSPRYRLAIRELGAEYEYCAVKDPQMKGTIERAFLDQHDLLETLPGRVYPLLQSPRGYDPKRDAVVRFSSFVWLLYKWVCDVYNTAPKRRNGPRRLDLWHDGLSHAPRAYVSDAAKIETIVGKKDTRKLTHNGIQFRSLTYSNAFDLEELFRRRGECDVDISVIESDLGHIYAKDRDSRDYFPVPSLMPEYANGLTLLQHEYISKLARGQYGRTLAPRHFLEMKYHVQQTVADELFANNNHAKRRLARLAGIDSEDVLAEVPTSVSRFAQAPAPQVAPVDPAEALEFPSMTVGPNDTHVSPAHFDWTVI